jgi:hypothetical protein
MQFIASERSSVLVAIGIREFALPLPPVVYKFSIVLVTLATDPHTLPTHLTLVKLTRVCAAVFPPPQTGALYFPIDKRTFVRVALAHHKNSLAVLLSTLPLPLILEATPRVVIDAEAVAILATHLAFVRHACCAQRLWKQPASNLCV